MTLLAPLVDTVKFKIFFDDPGTLHIDKKDYNIV